MSHILMRLSKAALCELITENTARLADESTEHARIRSLYHQQSAEIEALRADLDARRSEVAACNLRITDLEAELGRLQTVHHDAVQIKNRGELMAVMRQLARDGVPCFLRGTFVYHAQTKAILAQIGV